MIVKVEIADTAFNKLEDLSREVIGLTWDYTRMGGCGSFSFQLPRFFSSEKFISGDFNIKIYRRNPSTKTYDLWYQGLVEEKLPSVQGSTEMIEVRGNGYQAQLARIYISKTYTSTEISLIIKDILDTYIVPNTNISYVGGDLTATSFTPDSLKFNTDVLSAIQTCSDLVGTREWGVDVNRKFFFKQRSSTPGLIYYLGAEKVINFSSDDSFKDIINRVVIQGGNVAGTPFTATYNSAPSQLKYNLRTKVIQNSAVLTTAVAQQLATSVFAEFSDVVRQGKVDILEEKQFEATIPIPQFQLNASPVTYGEKQYGTFLYAGRINYQVNRITYTLDANGNLLASLDLGQQRPSVSEEVKQLQYMIEQLRSGTL